MKFSNLRKTHNDLRIAAMADPDYQEVQWIRTKFIENGLDIWDRFSWTLIDDFLKCREYNAVTKGQRAKVAELITKFGPSSMIWDYLIETKNQRQRDLDRLMALTRITVNSKDRSHSKIVNWFLKMVVNYRRMLLVNPFTDKQREYICKIERMVGVYYDDLSLEENGVVASGDKTLEELELEVVDSEDIIKKGSRDGKGNTN